MPYFSRHSKRARKIIKIGISSLPRAIMNHRTIYFLIFCGDGGGGHQIFLIIFSILFITLSKLITSLHKKEKRWKIGNALSCFNALLMTLFTCKFTDNCDFPNQPILHLTWGILHLLWNILYYISSHLLLKRVTDLNTKLPNVFMKHSEGLLLHKKLPSNMSSTTLHLYKFFCDFLLQK